MIRVIHALAAVTTGTTVDDVLAEVTMAMHPRAAVESITGKMIRDHQIAVALRYGPDTGKAEVEDVIERISAITSPQVASVDVLGVMTKR